MRPQRYLIVWLAWGRRLCLFKPAVPFICWNRRRVRLEFGHGPYGMSIRLAPMFYMQVKAAVPGSLRRA
jgi:hypothetical protein